MFIDVFARHGLIIYQRETGDGMLRKHT
jgi:hypothetical protein